MSLRTRQKPRADWQTTRKHRRGECMSLVPDVRLRRSRPGESWIRSVRRESVRRNSACHVPIAGGDEGRPEHCLSVMTRRCTPPRFFAVTKRDPACGARYRPIEQKSTCDKVLGDQRARSDLQRSAGGWSGNGRSNRSPKSSRAAGPARDSLPGSAERSRREAAGTSRLSATQAPAVESQLRTSALAPPIDRQHTCRGCAPVRGYEATFRRRGARPPGNGDNARHHNGRAL